MDTRLALTWKTMEGKQDLKARLVAKGYQDLKGGLAKKSGRVSGRPSRLQVLSLGAHKKWDIWSLGI